MNEGPDHSSARGALPLAGSLDEELWRRAETRRESGLYTDMQTDERMLLPLVLSLARLAAQRDAAAGR